jgi:RecB family exonuclease
MSDYYNPQRTRNLYDPKSPEPFRISRSKIDLFMNCPRCFYFDRRLGIGRPPGFPFALNSAVDALLKQEFDHYRDLGKPHPLMTKFKVPAVPFKHERMDEWRDALRRGVTTLHKPTNFLVTGGVDDIWETKKGELIVADYKATSKTEEITTLDKDWQIGYKRQSEVYQWLLRQNGFKVSDTAYFVYCNGYAGHTGEKAFDACLKFDINLIPYKGNDSWIEPALTKMKACLDSKKIPKAGEECDYCAYREAVKVIEN